MFKVNNKDNNIFNFEHLHFKHFIPCSYVSIVDFEHIIAGWAKFSDPIEFG